MRVKSAIIRRLHLDNNYGLLTARNAQLVWEYFCMLDVRGSGTLDDVQFLAFMSNVTDLNTRQIYKVFDVFDLDHSGTVNFDEFFLLFCMLISIGDNEPKLFMYRHWRTCFELLDENNSKTVSRNEFETLGFLFGYGRKAVSRIFAEFDVSGNDELELDEFRLFVLAAMDLQQELELKKSLTARLNARRQSVQQSNKGGNTNGNNEEDGLQGLKESGKKHGGRTLRPTEMPFYRRWMLPFEGFFDRRGGSD